MTDHTKRQVFTETTGALLITGALLLIMLLAPQPTIGQSSYHELPPPANIVGAGFNLEHSVKAKRTALWIAIIGGGATAILASQDPYAGAVVGGLTLMGTVGFSLHGLKWEGRSAALLQCGYSPTDLYESIPDSLGDDPPREYQIPNMIDGNKIHLPARFR